MVTSRRNLVIFESILEGGIHWSIYTQKVNNAHFGSFCLSEVFFALVIGFEIIGRGSLDGTLNPVCPGLFEHI